MKLIKIISSAVVMMKKVMSFGMMKLLNGHHNDGQLVLVIK